MSASQQPLVLSRSIQDIRKSIFAFSAPVVAELMLMSMISMVNLAMVGHLGAYAISAVGLTNQPINLILVVFQSLNVGATALVARFIGARDYKGVKTTIVQTLALTIGLGMILSIISYVFSRSLVSMMGAKEDTLSSATMYMQFMSWGIVLQAVSTSVTAILRGAGDSKTPMFYNTISNIVNIIAGILLIYDFAFSPGLGLLGAAIAATLAKITACVMSIYALLKIKLPINFLSWKENTLDFRMIQRIMNIGISAAGEFFFMRFGFMLYTMIVADLGTITFATQQIVLNLSSFAQNPVGSLSTASSSFAGRCLGAQEPHLAEEYCRQSIRLGFIFSLCVTALFFLAGYPLSRIYTSDVEVLVLSAFVLKIAAFISFPQNYTMIVAGCLRGAGDTRWPLVSSFIGMVIRISLAVLFVKVFHWGLSGAWFAALIDNSARFFLLQSRFRKGHWKTITI